MGKMKEMSATIEQLRIAAEAINEAVIWLTEQFSSTGNSVTEASESEKQHLPSNKTDILSAVSKT